MIKMITMIRRRPDLSLREFIERYESGHRLIGEKVLKGYATKYQRRFLLEPEPGSDMAAKPRHYDVVMEIWFPDQATMHRCFEEMSSPDVQAEIIADEATLFDRDSITSYVVEEHESDMGAQS